MPSSPLIPSSIDIGEPIGDNKIYYKSFLFYT